MAGRITNDRIERFAGRIDARLRADEESRTSMRVFTDSSLRRVLLDCGFERRGSRNLAQIEAALERRGVFADPPLTTAGLDWEQRIHFTRSPQVTRLDERRVGFRTEYDLETFLVENFDYVFPDLRLVHRQFEVQTGRVDLLARDGEGYVVIELKKGRPTKDLVFALTRYMDDVSAWLDGRGEPGSVRGLIVSEHVDQRMHDQLLRLAQGQGRRIDWMEYRVELVLRGVESPGGLPPARR